MSTDPGKAVFERELAYHERLYAGFAQRHFARPAVRALRAHLVSRILRISGAGPESRVLSLGCGIGDTEILLAPRVGEVVGVDLSPAAIRQARADAQAAGLRNARFLEGGLGLEIGEFSLVIAIFFLHHLPDSVLASAPRYVRRLLQPGGLFYSLDPNRYRLSGAIGRLVVPGLMKKYQSPDERELIPRATADLFANAGFRCRIDYYDFLSSPLAGLFPGWRAGYLASRAADEVLRRTPLLRRFGSNFEIVAR
ncbi:MAG: methyltransferase domain-containing protein [Acidobacteria bacterium]|nr:methyltransferase domain-containing protein [Acidobacteriota bacterium]